MTPLRRPRPTRSRLGKAILVLALLNLSGCLSTKVHAESYPDRPIVLVCPWAAGGGTDRVSRTIAAHLEADLACPVNVINATGGKGVTGHSRGLRARADGYTLLMATLELNMMHWTGLTSLTVDDCIPLMSVNEDYAALFVRKDAPWQDLQELERDIRSRPKRLKASGTTGGGAWHVAVAGWLSRAGMQASDVTWISSTGAGPSLQELMSGGIDLVCCALPEAGSLLDAGQIRALGVMAPKRSADYPNVKTFREQGTDWSLGGWRAIVVPVGTPQVIQQRLLASLQRIVKGETKVGDVTFPKFMQQQGFDHTFRSGRELARFLRETDGKFGELMTSESMRSVNRDRYNAATFPRLLLIGLGVVTLALVGQKLLGKSVPSPAATEPAVEQAARPDPVTRRGRVSFALIVVVMVGYVLLVETVGFVPYAAVSMFVLASWMGSRVWVSLLISVGASVTVYQLFSHLLRVPLPQGWLGW